MNPNHITPKIHYSNTPAYPWLEKEYQNTIFYDRVSTFIGFRGGLMALKVKSSTRGSGVITISPIGSIDAHSYSVLEEKVKEVLKQMPDVIIFDMEFADYISSTGIRVLLKTKKALHETGGRMVFMNLQPQIQKVFDILKAIPSLKVFASIEELDNYLDVMQKAAKK
jgi:anti-anti-sigma factor